MTVNRVARLIVGLLITLVIGLTIFNTSGLTGQLQLHKERGARIESLEARVKVLEAKVLDAP